MKLKFALVAILFCGLFFFSRQTTFALPPSLLPMSCSEVEMHACGGMSTPAHNKIPHSIDAVMLFAGVFTNTMVNVSGQITIEITINADDTITGNVNFTQFISGEQACGSGDFTGSKTGETIELSFTSGSVDPACGFFQGVTFTIEAALLNNTVIRGSYSTDTDQQGIVELVRIFARSVFMPLISH